MSSSFNKLIGPLRAKIRRWQEERILRRDLQRELRGELNPCRRLIVITGMARSGTSVTTAFVGSHPDVRLVIGGGCWDVCETDLIRPEMGEPDWDSIDELLRDNYPRRILLKQPWLQTKTTFLRAIRPAKVIVCLRDRIDQTACWSGSGRVSDRCKLDPTAVYDEFTEPLPRLLKNGATWVNQDQLNPAQADRLGRYLGLNPAGFDTSILGRRWKDNLEKDWLDKHSIRKERRRP